VDASALARHFLEDAGLGFRKQKELAERALAQVDDGAFFRTLDAEANSLAVIVQHVAGNLRSRWRDFLTTDGEKPDRHRDGEFELGPQATRADVMARWDEGWAILFATLEGLAPEDLLRTVTIRGEPHTVVQAIDRQLVHYAQHVGQIVLLAKHWAGPAWKTLSIPRGRSREFERAAGRVGYLSSNPA
jgi:hypothetical protein